MTPPEPPRPPGARPPRRTRLKCCGLRQPADVAAAVAAGADAIGFVVAAGSPRTIEPPAIRSLLASIPPWVVPVVVLRDQPDHPTLDLPGVVAQLHGHEDEAACAMARTRTGRPVVRAVTDDPDELARWDAHPDVGLLLVDGAEPGSGRAFDHRSLAEAMATLRTPVALAGGLDPTTVGPAIALVRPWAVDVSSGIESSRGVKDPARIDAFAAAVRAADAAAAADPDATGEAGEAGA